MKSILYKSKSYKNIILRYNNLLSRSYIGNKSLRGSSINIKYPIFLYKVTLFKLSGIVIRKHKRNLNSTITLSMRLSKNRINLNFPFNNGLIKFN